MNACRFDDGRSMGRVFAFFVELLELLQILGKRSRAQYIASAGHPWMGEGFLRSDSLVGVESEETSDQVLGVARYSRPILWVKGIVSGSNLVKRSRYRVVIEWWIPAEHSKENNPERKIITSLVIGSVANDFGSSVHRRAA